ncbi:DUF3696 domain-containing protein [Desulfobacterales bacterium HSG2]|nr:DUF3696 domain-containing protein [Desulfobacterales bacterium HSG2]
MISEYQITNFKSFAGPATIPVKPITLIFGPNSSGKSSLLQSVLMLKQTLDDRAGEETPLLPKGSLADLGNFREFVYRHDVAKNFFFKMAIPIRDRYEISEKDEILNSLISFKTMGLGITFSQHDNDLAVTEIGLFVGDNSDPIFTYELGQPDKEADKEGTIRFARSYHHVAKLKNFNDGHEYWQKYQRLFETPANKDHFKLNNYLTESVYDDASEEFMSLRESRSISHQILFYASRLFKESLRNLVYVGPLRRFPERYYTFTGNKTRYVGKSGEFVADILISDPKILDSINEQFEHLCLGYELRVPNLTDQTSEIHNLLTLRLKERASGTHVGFTDVGFGISQLLPIVVQSMVSENQTLLIEQPELHLHPALQAEMGDMFLRSALGENHNTFVIETHSEHLILRLLRRVRETEEGELPEGIPSITPDDLSVLYVEPDEHGGSSEVIHIPVTKDGEFERPWPRGFFHERAKELF